MRTIAVMRSALLAVLVLVAGVAAVGCNDTPEPPPDGGRRPIFSNTGEGAPLQVQVWRGEEPGRYRVNLFPNRALSPGMRFDGMPQLTADGCPAGVAFHDRWQVAIDLEPVDDRSTLEVEWRSTGTGDDRLDGDHRTRITVLRRAGGILEFQVAELRP